MRLMPMRARLRGLRNPAHGFDWGGNRIGFRKFFTKVTFDTEVFCADRLDALRTAVKPDGREIAPRAVGRSTCGARCVTSAGQPDRYAIAAARLSTATNSLQVAALRDADESEFDLALIREVTLCALACRAACNPLSAPYGNDKTRKSKNYQAQERNFPTRHRRSPSLPAPQCGTRGEGTLIKIKSRSKPDHFH
jgi:hypothetical protein